MASHENTPPTNALDVAVISLRLATDDGHRTGLDELIESFGWSRAELEPEGSAGVDAVLGPDV